MTYISQKGSILIAVVEVIKAVQGKTKELKKVLHELVPICRKGKGCLQYELFEPTEGNDEFLVFMKWKELKDLEQHETSKAVRDFIQKYDGVLYSEVTQYDKWKLII